MTTSIGDEQCFLAVSAAILNLLKGLLKLKFNIVIVIQVTEDGNILFSNAQLLSCD